MDGEVLSNHCDKFCSTLGTGDEDDIDDMTALELLLHPQKAAEGTVLDL